MKKADHQPTAESMRADDILYAAIEIEDADKRKTYVEKACAGNPAVRKEVELLFASLEDSTEFFKDESVTRISAVEISETLADIPEFFENLRSVLPDDDEVGKQFGPYKLLQRIGKGGAGSVYLAEQSRPVRRQVALKIIKRGMDTKSVIARFDAERQTLAMMEHPNIAHVLDAGETETGRPFFVMELVHGIKITTYCDENNLGIREQLELLVQVCHAIQHAHQKGIIHRDIKPSNVMITQHNGVPMPMVIDFGIAKATTDDLLTDRTAYTFIEPFIGTPAYMSPEQAQTDGMDVDTRSDIYSLGVLLYELLTGAPPFDQKELMKSGIDAMRKTLLECEPLRPSARFRGSSPEDRENMARNNRMEPGRLESLLRGELDWIALKSLEKDRTRRYETVESFAMDIERFLNNEPVLARPPSRRYRFRKLVRRNRVVFVSATVITLTLIGGLSTSSWLFFKEREARMRAVLAEQQQMHLRMASEDRERITQAAFLISQEEIEEADKIVDQVTELKPSLEAESVLRRLGKWHALREQWALAAVRFCILLKVDIKDISWRITDDLLMAGPILIERGDPQGYEHFRRAAIAQYQETSTPAFAERTLKICLLLPADEEIIHSLQPIEKLVQDNTSQELNQRESAQAHLKKGRVVIEAVFSMKLEEGDGDSGYWYDWLYARILLREAEARIEQGARQADYMMGLKGKGRPPWSGG
jgi:serine/threonine protein kinase